MNPGRVIGKFRSAVSLAALLVLPLLLWRLHRRERTRMIPQPRGMVLGLYAGLPDYDYGEELARIRDTGATAVSLQAIFRMDRFDSTEIARHPTSSPTEASLVETFRQARRLGLRMMFFPTINLRDEADNDTWWRGNICPRDWDAWWRNYTAFNVHLARIAQAEGVEWFSVGTEMESTHPFPDRWRALVREVRSVFKGKITYSVNFDAHDSLDFGDALDVIGMNTYDPICKHDAYPAPQEITNTWWWIVFKARTLQARFHRPVMITEVGYPSVEGAHAGPWDFRTARRVDLPLQDLLLSRAFGVLRNWTEGQAVFHYLYGEHLSRKPVGGPEDRTYAVWGKPSERTLRDYFAHPIFEGQLPPKPSDIRDAVIQVLASHHRKVRDYEDAALPPWVLEWERDHPDDRDAVRAILAEEPIPARKIPKGQER